MSTANTALASALGVILEQDNAQSDLEKKRAVAATLAPAEKADTDANFARETLYDMINKNTSSINDLMNVAKETHEARHYEVLAQLITVNAQMADKLLKVQVDHQIVQNNAINLERNKSGGSAPGSNVHIGQAVFVGTTKELLAMVRKANEEQVIEVDAKPVDEDDNE